MPGLLDYVAPQQPDTIWGLSKEDIARLAPAFRAPERNALPVANWLLQNVVPGSSDAVALKEAYDASGRMVNEARAGNYGRAALETPSLLASSLAVLPMIPSVTKPASDIDGLRKGLDAAYPGVSHHVSETPNAVVVNKVVVPKDQRGQGIGTKFMQDVIAYADQLGKPVALSPSSDFGGVKSKLEKWYRSLGFAPNSGRAKDFEISESMIRPPSK